MSALDSLIEWVEGHYFLKTTGTMLNQAKEELAILKARLEKLERVAVLAMYGENRNLKAKATALAPRLRKELGEKG